MRRPRTANEAQKAAASYRLAALDSDFMMGESMRGVRLQIEYSKAEEALRAWGIRSTIVVFGSARSREGDPEPHGRWYAQAREFGCIASRRGGALIGDVGQARDNVIATGGGPGVMEAANRGAADAGAPSVGFNITLPTEQEPNAWSTPDLTFQFHYFAVRKMHLAMRANALVVFPGGFGTFDELFEILTLRRVGRAAPIPIVLVDRAFWNSVLNLDVLVRTEMIRPSDLELYSHAETAEEVWQRLLDGGLKPHEVID